MEQLVDAAEMVAWAERERALGHSIGLVPTMGYLHAGHASLMALLRPNVDRLVVSVYVNPLQFGPGEDLDHYPRDPAGDAATCRGQGADALFMPADLYPDGFSTSVSVHGLSEGLCGARRPGHFEGVATVCARLFGLTRCTRAVFGEKDYQQLAVLRRMVRDLALPLTIVGAPLVRDNDGVALSSRNKYLSAEERARARSLYRALRAVQAGAEAGEHSVEALRAAGRAALDVDQLDYLEIVDPDSLQPLEKLPPRAPLEVDGDAAAQSRARALVAAYVGSTRLIDNLPLA